MDETEPTVETASHVVPRTGELPLRFTGVLLAHVSTASDQGPGNHRWHHVRVYRTVGGRYILAVAFRTCWSGELDHDWAYECADARELGLALGESPNAFIPDAIGYPDREPYRERQHKLLAHLRARFHVAVSELYRRLGDEFAEEVA
jgi:hypothetical protein